MIYTSYAHRWYSPTPTICTRKERTKEKLTREDKIFNTWLANQEAGYVTKGKFYKSVCIKGRNYRIHRLIWKMFTGEDTDMQIDHIDRNPINNKIENLRLVTSAQNQYNSTFKRGKYDRGVVKQNNKFYVNILKERYGPFNTEEEAINCRKKKEIELFKEFAPI